MLNMEDDDEIDILGDFNLENLLTKNDGRISCYDGDNQLSLNCDYSSVPSQWILDTNTQSVWYDKDDKFNSQIPLQIETFDPNGWSDKEKYLLEKGLELFGQSWSRLSQYIGSKTPHQVKNYLKSNPLGPYTEQFVAPVKSDGGDVFESLGISSIPASMEEVITVVSTAVPTVPSMSPKRKNRTLEKQKKKPQEKQNIKVPKSKLSSIPEYSPTKPQLQPPTILKSDNLGVFPGEVIKISKYECSSDDSEIDIEDDISIRNGTILLPKPPQPAHVQLQLLTAQNPLRENDRCSSALVRNRYMEMKTKRLKAIYKLPKPEKEFFIRFDHISEEEKRFHPEFFENAKNPYRLEQRYLTIRNHIVEKWEESKPSYVTKTATRRGLKNCGDVNLIGRVHAYLEQIGAINFGCEQCRYNRENSSSDDEKSKVKESSEPEQRLTFDSSLIINGTRKRKKKVWSPDPYHGKSLNVSGGGGYTMEHDESGVVTVTHISEMTEEPEAGRRQRKKRAPIELIPCEKFTLDHPAPYSIEVEVGPLLASLVHSHTSPGREVMGLLGGGVYEDGVLRLQAAVPCSASSSEVHCDMCPVSQCEGAKAIQSLGMTVAGWYHSHPCGGGPDPSAQDIASQDSLQTYFGRHGPFTALILSPTAVPKYKFFTLEEVEGVPKAFELSCRISSIGFEMNPVLSTVTDIIDKSETPPSSFTQCVEDVKKVLSWAKPDLDPAMIAVFASKLESIFTEDRNTNSLSQMNDLIF